MIGEHGLRSSSAGYSRWRLLRGYVASRRLPDYWLMLLILLGMVVWGSGWGERHAPATLQMLVFLLPVATASVIGISIWSPFGETERVAGTWLPLGRFLHLLSMLAIALLIDRVALATWVPADDPERWDLYLQRHTAALVGVALLAARVIDSRLNWVAPALVAMPALVVGYIRTEQAEAEGRTVSFFHDSWHPMLHPHDSLLAWTVAIGLFAIGMAILVRSGERLAELDDTAG